MTNWMYYPKNEKAPQDLVDIINAFKSIDGIVDSTCNKYKSNEVLGFVAPYLISLGFDVEVSKKSTDKIRRPVLYGLNGKEELSFEADAYCKKTKTVLEVEAGRAYTNYQFLKDFFQACMMLDAEYLVIAARNIYRNNKDFEKICYFFDALYNSNKMGIPLKGLLIIGY